MINMMIIRTTIMIIIMIITVFAGIASLCAKTSGLELCVRLDSNKQIWTKELQRFDYSKQRNHTDLIPVNKSGQRNYKDLIPANKEIMKT